MSKKAVFAGLSQDEHVSAHIVMLVGKSGFKWGTLILEKCFLGNRNQCHSIVFTLFMDELAMLAQSLHAPYL